MKKKIYSWFSYRKLLGLIIIVSVISMLPIIYCSFFTYATGDDLWEGAAVYRVLEAKGSMRDLILAVWAQLKMDYMGWQGNWSSSILWYFSPNVFGEKVYVVTPYIGLISIILGYWYSFSHFNNKYLKLKKDWFLILYVLITVITIQYMPNVKNGLFWYSGMINYTFPYGIVCAITVWLDRFLEAGEKRYFCYLILAYSFLGGSGYLSIVLSFEILVLAIILSWKDRRTRMLLIPMILLLIGFIISAISPGNAVRGGESYGFSISNIFYTLKECIVQGILAIPKTLWNTKILILLIPAVVTGTWENLELVISRMRFRYPGIVVLLLFLISCSVYAPGIYANNHVSGGVHDTIFFVFLLFFFFSMIYVTGYCKKKWIDKKSFEVARKENKGVSQQTIKMLVYSTTIAVAVLLSPVILSRSSYRLCLDYITSGQLRDFEFQMQERLAILHDPSIKDVVLPAMNDWQGPFMHMCVLEDPNAYTNMATARYYDKNSVVVMPRDEYYEIYGYPNID